jgi:hypothetical protein
MIKNKSKKTRKPDGYYTFEKCWEIALTCNSKKEFENKNCYAYDKCRFQGWIEIVSLHMDSRRFPNKYWTKEKCADSAKDCKTKSEFKKKDPKAYSAAVDNKWIKDICQHMELIGHRYSRAIYAFEFADKSVYVGLTHNYEERYHYHLTQGYVSEKIDRFNAVFVQFNVFYIPEKAAKMEGRKIQEYKNKGWTVLNKAKAGSIGAKEKIWNKHSISKEAKKYKTRKDFYTNNNSAYTLASKNGWLQDVCSHMKGGRHGFGYWTKEKCLEVAKHCKTLSEFNQKYRTASNKSVLKGWYKEVTKHFVSKRKKRHK